jgi:hypothetical protein
MEKKTQMRGTPTVLINGYQLPESYRRFTIFVDLGFMIITDYILENFIIIYNINLFIMKLKKISLQNIFEHLTDAQMKATLGGYDGCVFFCMHGDHYVSMGFMPNGTTNDAYKVCVKGGYSTYIYSGC